MSVKKNKIVAIIDHDSGNVSSVSYILKKLNYKFKITKSANDIDKSDYLIIPGVGSYSNCMKKIKDFGLERPIKKFTKNNKKVLGICVGMQILSTIGDENEISDGLNLIPGKVEKLKISKKFILPHIGWNNLVDFKANPLLSSINDKDYFYFLHSYSFYTPNKYCLGKVSYGGKLSTAIVSNRRNIFGVQFHPERSQQSGIKIFKNFLELC